MPRTILGSGKTRRLDNDISVWPKTSAVNITDNAKPVIPSKFFEWFLKINLNLYARNKGKPMTITEAEQVQSKLAKRAATLVAIVKLIDDLKKSEGEDADEAEEWLLVQLQG
jgi:hypothetical protein